MKRNKATIKLKRNNRIKFVVILITVFVILGVLLQGLLKTIHEEQLAHERKNCYFSLIPMVSDPNITKEEFKAAIGICDAIGRDK